MKKKYLILIILAFIMIAIGLFFLFKNKELSKSKVEIIDATYSCNQMKEKIYENKEHKYYFSCQKSNSVYVKFPNGTKTLVVSALNDKTVTIDELIAAGLDVIVEDK